MTSQSQTITTASNEVEDSQPCINVETTEDTDCEKQDEKCCCKKYTIVLNFN